MIYSSRKKIDKNFLYDMTYNLKGESRNYLYEILNSCLKEYKIESLDKLTYDGLLGYINKRLSDIVKLNELPEMKDLYQTKNENDNESERFINLFT